MKSLFKWNGDYIGTENNGNIFDHNGNYLGWIERNGEVYDKNGIYKGELIEDEYLLKNTSKLSPMNKLAKLVPLNIIAPIPPLNRVGKVEMFGWEEIDW